MAFRRLGARLTGNASTFSVEFALNIKDRGLVVLCCLPDPKKANVCVGDPIEFLRPDGSSFQTTVRALDMVMDGRPGLFGLVLPAGVEKDAIPLGTRIRLLNANEL